MIRVDDYPTGVRPIPPSHIEVFKPILQQFEDRKLFYFLGIVPTLCNKEDWNFLNSLRYMIPACHGYDHLQPKYAPSLINDPYNSAGVGGGDNEFESLSREQTTQKISLGLQILRNNLIKNTYSYIPPFNRINEFVPQALINNDVRLFLCENIRISGIECVSSGPFYVRSNTDLNLSSADCITLHLTWEWDLIREGRSNLGKMLDNLWTPGVK